MKQFLITVQKTEVIEAVDIAAAMRQALRLVDDVDEATAISIEDVTTDDDA